MQRLRDTLSDGVLEVALAHGGGNAIDQIMIEELLDVLADAGERADVRAVLLTGGTGKIFCAGFDLMFLAELERAALADFLEDFSALYQGLFGFPKPLVAGLNGHAIAGGALLAVTADVRVAPRTGVKIGVNEIDLGVPLPGGCVPMLENLLGKPGAYHAAMTGKLFEPAEALAIGLVDELADDPVGRGRAVARELAGKPPAAWACMKALLRGPTAECMAAADAGGHDAFVDHWTSAEAQGRIGKVVEGLRARAR